MEDLDVARASLPARLATVLEALMQVAPPPLLMHGYHVLHVPPGPADCKWPGQYETQYWRSMQGEEQ